MNLNNDIVIATSNDFDNILADTENTSPFDTVKDVGVSIDDIVTVVAILRGVIDDRPAWWKLRREAYSHFASHPEITTRTLARLPDGLRDELADLDASQIRSLSASWIDQDQATPNDIEVAIVSLQQLVGACVKTRKLSSCVFIRSFESTNAFETAFSRLSGKKLKTFRKAFDSWDSTKKHEAHERYKYYANQGHSKCVDLVLRDFARQKTTKLNLRTDQRNILRHIKKRIKDYSKHENAGPGRPEDSITLITMASQFEQAGWVALVFDTRTDAEPDGEWNKYIEENAIEFDHWCEAWERLCEEGTEIKITCHDGSKQAISSDADTEQFGAYIGTMLRDVLIRVRDDGAFARLPLAQRCLMCVDEHDGNYGWPDIETLLEDGRVN